jgi:hypothetical protein
MSPKTRNEIPLVLAWLFVAAAIATVLPVPGASVKSDLGYYSFCPFAPWSTLVLLIVAGLFGAIRTYMVSRKD